MLSVVWAGTLLVWGGWCEADADALELFELEIGCMTWRRLAVEGEAPLGVYNHSMCLLGPQVTVAADYIVC